MTFPLQELLPIVPLFPAQAASPRHAVLPTGALLSSQASTPLQEPVPTPLLLSKQAASPLHDCGHGSHARDSQGAADGYRKPTTNASGAVLCLGCLDHIK